MYCRATVQDMELGGYKVPKGTLLFLSMGGMHVSPHNFLEPHRFYPVSRKFVTI
jgi:cytochrome P450